MSLKMMLVNKGIFSEERFLSILITTTDVMSGGVTFHDLSTFSILQSYHKNKNGTFTVLHTRQIKYNITLYYHIVLGDIYS